MGIMASMGCDVEINQLKLQYVNHQNKKKKKLNSVPGLSTLITRVVMKLISPLFKLRSPMTPNFISGIMANEDP